MFQNAAGGSRGVFTIGAISMAHLLTAGVAVCLQLVPPVLLPPHFQFWCFSGEAKRCCDLGSYVLMFLNLKSSLLTKISFLNFLKSH